MYLIFALLAFSILIIVHELGHFTLAKLNGIYVEEFAIGMGPKLFGIKGKETEYSIRILPFGGYVRMLGEDEDVSDRKSFSSKTPIQKILVIAAGAFMNYVLAIVIFTLISANFGFVENRIGEVQADTPAQQVGLQPGDEFLKINGKKIHTSDDLAMGLSMSKSDEITLEIKRDGNKITKTITPVINEEGRKIIGITYEVNEKPSIIESIKHSLKKSVTMVVQTYDALKMIVTGEANLKTDVGGPITIIKMSGQVAKMGVWNLMQFMAFLSIQLAVFNLLPLPALDGGLILIQLIELITRRKIPEKYIQTINNIGFMFLMLLMVLVTLKDIIFPVM